MKKVSYSQFVRYRNQNARKNSIPVTGCFELTPLCNLDCKMCYIHLTDPSVKERMLSGDEWIALMEQAIARGMISATITGGEAMTHPDFRKIYMYLIGKGISVMIKTNGILLNNDMISLLTEYPPLAIDVSLYGCDSESYIAVTGHDVFETVTGNIRAAIDAGLNIRLMITPSAYMLPWIDRIMDYARTFGADKVLVSSVLMEANTDTGRSISDYGFGIEDSLRISRRSHELFPNSPKNQEEEEEELMGEIPEDEPRVLPKGLSCNAGRTTFAINWDGTMGPCLNFPRDVICADVKRIGFNAAWQEVNHGVKEYEIPEECLGCSYNTGCRYCPSRHRRFAAKHLCDSTVCEQHKKYTDDITEYIKKHSF